VQEVDGHNPDEIEAAIRAAQEEMDHPSLIACRTHIGYGSPNKQDTASSHGSPLGVEEVTLTKEKLGWPANANFMIPEKALAVFRQAVEQGQQAEAQWRETFDRYQAAHPGDAALLEQLWAGELPAGWADALPKFSLNDGPLATRQASGVVLNALAPALPTLIGGSADLAPSTNTLLGDFSDFQQETPAGRNFRFGVREHAMGSILNGLAVYGGVIPYGATFLVFSDYMRPAVRLAAMMSLPVIFVWTHDSVWLGEDGPTHQPVEHLAALRTIPNLIVIRPADANETAAAWRLALERKNGPTALILTRQKLPVPFETMQKPFDKVSRGAYILTESSGVSNALIIASGSEVHLALEARELLAEQGVGVRIVSMPSQELFDAQPTEYQDSVLPPPVTVRLVIEAGVTHGWEKYVGPKGDVLGLDRFGASAPYKVLMEKFGFTAEAVAERVLQLLK
jgi:transketolase